ncbi:GspMb/PilO family protein [Methylobacterium sp. CB376]|uniref:GspMb/PilO family protein n=1 Tax=Methylobacterium sp. CB376 TaxID=3138063 RepID=UPI0024B061B8|nr:GspMb/PilO family protein [Methylobacterium nodulans]WFT81435.1 GspMb/PilO family protein [Methylobacterium nodulans]
MSEAAARPTGLVPLFAADAPALLAAFRARLDALAAGRAVLVDAVHVEPDPGRLEAPRLAAVLRGTTEGLRGLLLALETEEPLVVLDRADLTIVQAAEPEAERPTLLQLALAARGVVVPPRQGAAPPRQGAAPPPQGERCPLRGRTAPPGGAR